MQEMPISSVFTCRQNCRQPAVANGCRQLCSGRPQEHKAVAKAKGKTDFIFQRPGSDNWWIKLRSGGQRTERSLGTPDRQLADVLAAPLIAD